jgi:hypothetical protein
MLRRAVWQKLTDVSEVLTASVIRAGRLMTDKVSEASVNFCHTTRRSIQEHSSIYLVLILQTKTKIKAVPLHVMLALWGEGGIAPTYS